VSAGGGTPVPVTQPDAAKKETAHRHPWFLPDGRHFLFTVTTGPGGSFSVNSVHVGSLDGEPPKVLTEADAQGIYASGFLLFVRDGTLLAQPFDPDRLVTTGDPLVVAEDVAIDIPAGLASLSASTTGMLSYRTTLSGGVVSQLVWVDRSGKVLETIGQKADQSELRLAPDGTRVAVSVLDPARRTRDIWIYDLTRDGLRTRLTFDAGEDWSSAWSPDGRSLVFSAGRPNPLHLYRKPSDGSGTEERLVEGVGTSTSAVGLRMAGFCCTARATPDLRPAMTCGSCRLRKNGSLAPSCRLPLARRAAIFPRTGDGWRTNRMNREETKST